MNQCVLDNDLIDALFEMSVSNWARSQKILAHRLQRVPECANNRLNLFLLSVAAASGGYEEVANQLWSQAQQAEINEHTQRYFDLQLAPNDPRQSVLLDLERAWWDFNGWNQAVTSLKMESALSIDWDFVVEAALEGGCARIEERYARCFDDDPLEGALLWNLLALAYLEAGDLRTYDEMAQNSLPLVSSCTLPPQLRDALQQRDLLQAAEQWQEGRWVSNLALAPDLQDSQPSLESLTAEQWHSQMTNGFALLDLGRFLEAAREFQMINSQTGDRQMLVLGLNALSLTFFKLGDYTQCERVYQEFQTMLGAFPVEANSELAHDYLVWLQSVEAEPPAGQAFFSPFGTKSTWNESDSLDSAPLDFWQQFELILNHLADSDHVKARVALQKLEVNQGSTMDSFQRYLLALLFMAGSVMAGDYGEVQDLAEEIRRLEGEADFANEHMESVADSLRWAGFDKLHQRISGGSQARALPLNPWEDLMLAR